MPGIWHVNQKKEEEVASRGSYCQAHCRPCPAGAIELPCLHKSPAAAGQPPSPWCCSHCCWTPASLIYATLLSDQVLPAGTAPAQRLTGPLPAGSEAARGHRGGRAGSCILSPSVLYPLIDDEQGDKGQGWLSVREGGGRRTQGEPKEKTSKPTNCPYPPLPPF